MSTPGSWAGCWPGPGRWPGRPTGPGWPGRGAGFTFVTVQGSEAVNVLIYGGQYLASYPMQIYGSALRFLFVWVVPIGLAIYVPALAILGRQGPPGLPGWLAWLSAPMAAAFLAVGGLAWRAGIRHYVGTGS